MFLLRGLTGLAEKLVFSALLLLGMQLPNFILQYQQVVTAHLVEAENQLRQYQAIADRFYSGNIQNLVREHRHNPATAIRAEAGIINRLMRRRDYLQKQVTELKNKQFFKQIWLFSKQVDAEMTREVLNGYIWTVPLTSDAIISGLTLALSMNLSIYLMLGTVRQTGRLLRRRRMT